MSEFLEFLSSLFGKEALSYRQKDFVKAFVVIFPLSYTELLYNAGDAFPTDLPSRCMIAACTTVMAEILSCFWLYAVGRLERARPRTGIGYYIGPAYLFFLIRLTGFNPWPGRGILQECFNSYIVFFTPLFALSICMYVIRGIMDVSESCDQDHDANENAPSD